MNKEINQLSTAGKFSDLYTNSQNLSYSLIKGSINHLQAKIISIMKFESHAGHSEIAIIGASHYLRIGNIFTELLTCLPESIHRDRMWLYKNNFNSFQKSIEIPKLVYKINIWKQKFKNSTEFTNNEKNIALKKQNLYHSFVGQSAITALKITQENNKLHLKTVHTYPETNTFVYSETKLIFK